MQTCFGRYFTDGVVEIEDRFWIMNLWTYFLDIDMSFFSWCWFLLLFFVFFYVWGWVHLWLKWVSNLFFLMCNLDNQDWPLFPVACFYSTGDWRCCSMLMLLTTSEYNIYNIHIQIYMTPGALAQFPQSEHLASHFMKLCNYLRPPFALKSLKLAGIIKNNQKYTSRNLVSTSAHWSISQFSRC